MVSIIELWGKKWILKSTPLDCIQWDALAALHLRVCVHEFFLGLVALMDFQTVFWNAFYAVVYAAPYANAGLGRLKMG